jgi:hypothetical protein
MSRLFSFFRRFDSIIITLPSVLHVDSNAPRVDRIVIFQITSIALAAMQVCRRTGTVSYRYSALFKSCVFSCAFLWADAAAGTALRQWSGLDILAPLFHSVDGLARCQVCSTRIYFFQQQANF